MSMFVALTPLLKLYAGRRTRQFNKVMARVCRTFQEHPGRGNKGGHRVIHADYQGSSIGDLVAAATAKGDKPADFFAPDGFHPGPKALQYMAEHLYERAFAVKCTQLHSLVGDGDASQVTHRLSFPPR